MKAFIVRTVPKPSNTKRVRVGEYLGTHYANSPDEAIRKAGYVPGEPRKGEQVIAVPDTE